MQFVVFEKKFTSAYLFQIAREKSCDYSLIICMKKFEFKHEMLDEKLFDLGESKVKTFEPETAKLAKRFHATRCWVKKFDESKLACLSSQNVC